MNTSNTLMQWKWGRFKYSQIIKGQSIGSRVGPRPFGLRVSTPRRDGKLAWGDEASYPGFIDHSRSHPGGRAGECNGFNCATTDRRLGFAALQNVVKYESILPKQVFEKAFRGQPCLFPEE